MGHMPKECLQSYLQSVDFFISDLARSTALPKRRWCLHSFCLLHPTILFQKDYSVKYTKHAKKKSKKHEKIATFRASYSLLDIYRFEERSFSEAQALALAPLLWNPPLLCSSFASFTASSRQSLLRVPLRMQKPWLFDVKRLFICRLLRQPSADLPVFGIPWQFGPILEKTKGSWSWPLASKS